MAPFLVVLATSAVMLASGVVNQGLSAPSGLGWLRWSLKEECPFAPSPAVAVKEALRDRIVAQPHAVSQIIDAVSAWESWLRRGVSHPLVLAFTGSTGVGKTATATALAAALLGAALPAGRDAASTLRGRPGLLQLSGSDYGDGAAVAVPVLRRRLRHALAQLLYECHGTGVVVLDEAQKMNPAVLEALRPFVDQRSTLNYYADAAAAGGADGEAGGASTGAAADQGGGGAHEGGPVALSIRRLVLIVVADIGQDAIDRFLLAEGAAAAGTTAGSGGGGGDASHLLRDRLMGRLRRQLEDEWAGAGADLAGLVQSVVPFMPFAQPGVRALLEQHAARLSEDVAAGSSGGGDGAAASSSSSFDALSIDADVSAHLSSRDLFGGYSVPVLDEPAAGEAPAPAAAAVPRATSPSASLAAASVAADGTASGLPPPSSSPPPAAAAAAAWCVEAHPPFWTSSYGARGVLFHDGSPGRMLAALVARLGEAHPWEEGPGSGGGGDDDAAEGDWHAIAPPPPMPGGGVGQGTGRWLMAALYSAGQWAGGGGVLPPSAGGSSTSSKGASGYSRLRRVTLRISAACDGSGLGSGPGPGDPAKAPSSAAAAAVAAARQRRARHAFSALRCVLRPAAPSSGPAVTPAPWEEACRVVWSGQLPVD